MCLEDKEDGGKYLSNLGNFSILEMLIKEVK